MPDANQQPVKIDKETSKRKKVIEVDSRIIRLQLEAEMLRKSESTCPKSYSEEFFQVVKID